MLNKAKGRMFKSVGWTWNPVSGCDHGCAYCWARMMTEQYHRSFEPQFRESYLKDRMPNDGSWIFVCSTGDLFCPGMKDDWIYKVLYRIQREKGNNKFLLTTKNPFSFLAFYLELEKMKDKLILGTTIETNRDTPWTKAPPTKERKEHLWTMRSSGFKTFLSLEPLADFDFNDLMSWIVAIDPAAVEIGLENYTHFTTRPPDTKIRNLKANLDALEIPYILKDNLAYLEEAKG